MKTKRTRRALLIGIGLDGNDGHVRITRGENFRLFGGSQETHEQMQETAVKINERLAERGKKLEDASVGELRQIAQDVGRPSKASGPSDAKPQEPAD